MNDSLQSSKHQFKKGILFILGSVPSCIRFHRFLEQTQIQAIFLIALMFLSSISSLAVQTPWTSFCDSGKWQVIWNPWICRKQSPNNPHASDSKKIAIPLGKSYIVGGSLVNHGQPVEALYWSYLLRALPCIWKLLYSPVVSSSKQTQHD